VHVLAEMRDEWPLDKVVYSWKTWTAKCANKVLERDGSFWARDFHDRYIRDGEHLMIAKKYIEENPWKARLCTAPELWRWSSAWKGRRAGSQDN
jgi:putative transposase